MKYRINHLLHSSWNMAMLLASERSERDTLRSVQSRIADIYIFIYTLYI